MSNKAKDFLTFFEQKMADFSDNNDGILVEFHAPSGAIYYAYSWFEGIGDNISFHTIDSNGHKHFFICNVNSLCFSFKLLTLDELEEIKDTPIYPYLTKIKH